MWCRWGRGFKVLGDIEAQGKTKAGSWGQGAGCRLGTDMSAGGAVGAVLGGRGAGRALKWEFIVFLKENIGFLRSGELPKSPGSEVWAPSGALGGASGRSPGAVGRVLGALGSSFQRSGTTLDDLGADFLGS